MLGLFIFMEGFLLILDININDDIEVYRRKLFYILELLVIYEEFILEEYIEMIVMVYDIDCDEVMNWVMLLLKIFCLENELKVFLSYFFKGMK